jgi:hypothetical protein
MFGKYISFSIGLGILAAIAGGIVQWLNISTGSLIDWLIGIASFWWLLVIVTIPWNIYFDARETLIEAEVSQEKGIEIDLQPLNYVQKVARWSIVGAIALHLISASALYWLAVTGISNVGYVSSGLILLLTILRPAIRGYQYLTARLLKNISPNTTVMPDIAFWMLFFSFIFCAVIPSTVKTGRIRFSTH